VKRMAHPKATARAGVAQNLMSANQERVLFTPYSFYFAKALLAHSSTMCNLIATLAAALVSV
jgi:hypothetical protein